jgi:uncharacterized membrane protein YqjE
MNLVALLIVPLVVTYSGNAALRTVVAVLATLLLGGAIWYSKSRKATLLSSEDAVPEARDVSETAQEAITSGS